MFCIRSDVITLKSIEMYGLVTVWTSMDDGPYWVILLMYGSYDMRLTGFRRLTVVNRTPGFWGVTITLRVFDMQNLHRLCIYEYELIESTGFKYFVGNKILFDAGFLNKKVL